MNSGLQGGVVDFDVLFPRSIRGRRCRHSHSYAKWLVVAVTIVLLINRSVFQQILEQNTDAVAFERYARVPGNFFQPRSNFIW
jgi:hypothetical protein